MKSSFLTKREIWVIIALAAVCAAALIALSLAERGNTAAVSYNGEEIERIRLDRDGVYHITADLPVTLEVKDSKIRFVDSQCPDLLCEGFGWIGDEYEYAVCMPAKVVVMIESPG